MLAAPLSGAFKEVPVVIHIETVALLLSAFCSAVLSFFDFAAKSERHFAYAARYADLVTDIEQELAKEAQFRQQVDTFSLRIKMTYDSLSRTAPDV